MSTLSALLIAPLLLWACFSVAQAAEVKVAVAANFTAPDAEDCSRLSNRTAVIRPVAEVSALTGKFYTQIVAGAPFDVLIWADDETPKTAAPKAMPWAGSNFTYAIGKLVLWSAQPGYVDDKGAVLAAGKFAHLAIANPKVAPYGRAGLEVIEHAG